MDEPEKSGVASPTLPPVVEIRRGSFKELTLYDVEESELELLAQGSPDSLYLNFAIFLLSVAMAFLTSLLTAVLSQRIFIVFVVITVVGFIVGILLLIIWLRKRRSISALVSKIRGRLPQGIPTIAVDESR